MSDKKDVSVKGGGSYHIKEWNGTHYVTKDDPSSLIFTNTTNVGQAKSFDDALAMVRSDSGKPIKEIC